MFFDVAVVNVKYFGVPQKDTIFFLIQKTRFEKTQNTDILRINNY